MQKFTVHHGKIVVLQRDNIDTDQIIPKEFLKSIRRTGFGPHLFHDWRYLPDGKDNPEFELNRSESHNATILIAGNNFGCGSSREHAVWAIQQYGFRVVLAPEKREDAGVIPAFADIFRNNAMKNGLVTVELQQDEMEKILSFYRADPNKIMTVDLQNQTLAFGSEKLAFVFDVSQKHKILEGLDDIALTLQDEADLRVFESRHDFQITAS